MPTLVDVIDNYADGSTGTITDANGLSVGYAITGNNVVTTNGNIYVYDDDSAQVYANPTANSYFDATFSHEVTGLLIEMRGSDAGETFAVRINGAIVDLNLLISTGAAVFTTEGAGLHSVTANGQLTASGVYNDGSVGYVQFNFPIIQLGIIGTGIDPARPSGFDTFEIGIVPSAAVCFCDGTLIDTPNGPRAIETLRRGDLVMTLDHGAQPIRWIGATALDRIDLALERKRHPVRIRAGALGGGLPLRDLMVSRQHRVLLRTEGAAERFGATEVLIPAIKLVGRPGIEIVEDVTEVRYWHLLFEQHELVFSEGSLTESLYPGREAKKSLSRDAREELIALGFWDAETDQPAVMARTEIRRARDLRDFWADCEQLAL